jgi:creatinine amidohydrolase/Fe(II)-dependent formamide hydrolase-like protein
MRLGKYLLLVYYVLSVSLHPVQAQGLGAAGLNVNNVVELELLTHTEVSDKIHKGMTSVLIPTGGTEERGPQDVLGGHTIMAHARAVDAAKRLGNALVAPTLPVAVSATGAVENTQTPGAIQIPADVFKAVQMGMIESLSWSGFKDIFVMGDHGGGQQQLKEAAEEMDKKLSAKGVHVYYVGDFYTKYQDDVAMYLYNHKLPIGGHGAMMETSEMMYREPAKFAYVRPNFKTVPFNPTGQTPEEWKAARDARIAAQASGNAGAQRGAGGGQRGTGGQLGGGAPAADRINNGLTGDPHLASKQIGKDFAEIGVTDTVAEIKKLMADRRATTQN